MRIHKDTKIKNRRVPKRGNIQTDTAFIGQMQEALKTLVIRLTLKGIKVGLLYLKQYSLDVEIGVYYI